MVMGQAASNTAVFLQGLRKMRQNEGVGPLLANAALREHHKILDAALQLEDWTRSDALFVQVRVSFS